MIRFKFVCIFAIVLNWQCTNHRSSIADIGPPVMPGRQLNAMFLVSDGVSDAELVAPKEILRRTALYAPPGILVFTVAFSRDTITTLEGSKIITDYSWQTDSLPPIDIIVIPGARHTLDNDLQNIPLLDFVFKTGHGAAYIVAIGEGAFLVAKAGLLDLHECTTLARDIKKLREGFPQLKVLENVSFIHDRKIISAAGGSKSYEPALYLTQLLYGMETANHIAAGLMIEWNLSKVPAILTKR